MKRAGILSIIGIVFLAWLVMTKPFGEPERGGFTEILYVWSEEQSEMSEDITDAAVSGAEGKWVGEHQINGANWSIPNIIRHFLGVS